MVYLTFSLTICVFTGAFLIPYFISTTVLAIPLFILEVALGQFSAKGPIKVWAMCPILKGKDINVYLYIIHWLKCGWYTYAFENFKPVYSLFWISSNTTNISYDIRVITDYLYCEHAVCENYLMLCLPMVPVNIQSRQITFSMCRYSRNLVFQIYSSVQ